ncbi:MAG: 3-dehydroquinate synthase [Clostridia bacterium]|nr:3-dehydroquinate synthase [Clostridia bacterium]
MRTIHVNASSEYDVLIGDGLIDRSGELSLKFIPPCKCLIVADDNVDELYGDRVQISYSYSGYDVCRWTFPAGEASKNMDTLVELLGAMGRFGLSRSDLVVALGGGVTGDMAGFAAAIFARGIPFIQIPTTLLAAVDSSVGGKTAVDMPFGKNMVGAFHQPALVITDTDVIRDLPQLQRSNGIAEAVKCAVLNDPDLFSRLEGGRWIDDVEEIIGRCVTYKRDVVAADEFDRGDRAFLNLGHTFGHAIEQLSGYKMLHGQAVAVGMVMAASASGCDAAMIRRLAACLERNGLPVRAPYEAAVLARAALSDKKRAGSTITLVLPVSIGACRLDKVPVLQLEKWFERGLNAQREGLV